MMTITRLAATIVATAMLGSAAIAQGYPASGQIGPAKTPSGSMPSAPSNSTPQSGSQSGSPIPGAGSQNDNGGQAFPTGSIRTDEEAMPRRPIR